MADSATENPDSGNEETTARLEHFSVPKREWEEMKAQNLRILEALSHQKETRKGKKRKANKNVSESDDSSQSDGEVNDSPPKKSQAKNELIVDVDEQIDDLLADSEVDDDHDDQDDEGLREILQEYEPEEEMGPPISEKLASVVKNMTKAIIPEEKIREKMEKYKRPENCAAAVPKVNPEIWGLIDHGGKTQDLKVQKTQKRLVKATYALASVCDGLAKPSQMCDKKALMKKVSDAMALILKANHELSVERRMKIINSPNLNKRYRKLASNETPVTELLFGDDLKGSLQAIDSAAKLGQSMTHTHTHRMPKKFVGRAKNWGEPGHKGRVPGWNRGKNRGRGYTRNHRPWQQRPNHQ